MTRPLAKSIINFLLRRVIVRTTTIKYAQFDARPKFYVVVTVVCVCAYAMRAIRLDKVCSQKREGRKVLLWEVKERSRHARKGEAAIKSRIVGVL